MTTIALSHGGTTTYTGTAPARRLLVGTADGVAVLERDGARDDWRVVRRTLRDRHVSALLTPRPGLVVAGVASEPQRDPERSIDEDHSSAPEP